MTSTLPDAEARGPWMNWRAPLVSAAVVVLVEPDHLLLRDFGDGAVLLPGRPVLDGQSAEQAAQTALCGPGSAQVTLRPVLIDRRQQTRRQVDVHVLVTESIARSVADGLQPCDGRSRSLVVPRRDALEMLPARARLRAQFAMAALEFEDAAFVEWRAWLRPAELLGVPLGR